MLQKAQQVQFSMPSRFQWQSHVYSKIQMIPNIFSIWVADDSEFGNYNPAFKFDQTMDFGMYTYDICGGIESVHEAEQS